MAEEIDPVASQVQASHKGNNTPMPLIVRESNAEHEREGSYMGRVNMCLPFANRYTACNSTRKGKFA